MSIYSFEQILYQCITPLHVGCGQDVGIVDLPVIRERTTSYPVIPGSGVRGAFRSRMEDTDQSLAVRIFGAEEGDEQAGCVSILDARLLLYPVRSAPGIFHWVTSPFVLARFVADCEAFLGTAPVGLTALPVGERPSDGQYLGPPVAPTLHLEEFPFAKRPGTWRWGMQIAGVDSARVVVIDDEAFRYFAETATMVVQRNRLTAAKTVVDGQLFSIEAVPPEAVFYGFMGAVPERPSAKEMAEESGRRERRADDAARPAKLAAQEILSFCRGLLAPKAGVVAAPTDPPFCTGSVVLGGEESVGFGITRLHWRERATAGNGEGRHAT